MQGEIFCRLAMASSSNEQRRVPRENAPLRKVAPEAGFEPATRRLTVACSTAELLRKNSAAAGGMAACEGASFGRASVKRQVHKVRPAGSPAVWRPGPESNRH